MEPSSHLSVILDLSPLQWHLSSSPNDNPYPLTFRSFLTQTLAFLNSHLAFKHENTLAVYGALPGKSLLLYSSTEVLPEDGDDFADANSYLPFKALDTLVTKHIVEELDNIPELDEEPPCQLVGALTKALCYINRMLNPSIPSTTATDAQASPPEPRILILSVSPDLSTSYIPLMNSIFSAQKLKVTIDVCKIFGPDAVFLQQAAHLTGGSYIYLERRDALLQHLLMTFLPGPSMRRKMAVPTQDKIDFRAACFCHKTIIDVGFVCSVCLSIFCQPTPVCSTCRTKFPIKSLQRLNALRPNAPPPVSNIRPSRPATPAGSHRPVSSGLTSSLNSSPAHGNLSGGTGANISPPSVKGNGRAASGGGTVSNDD